MKQWTYSQGRHARHQSQMDRHPETHGDSYNTQTHELINVMNRTVIGELGHFSFLASSLID